MLSRPIQALIFALLIAALLLAGCQANPDLPTATVVVTPSGKTPTPRVTPTATALPKASPTPTLLASDGALKGKTVLFWHPWSGELAKQVDEAVAEFNRSNEWGITVQAKALYSAGSLFDAVNAGLKNPSNGLPQAIAATGDQLSDWSAHQDAVVDLNTYLNNPQVGMSEAETKAFVPAFWAQDVSGSRRLGIPALRSAQVIFYNQTWAKELGFSAPPKTPQEFQQQACAAAKLNNTLNSKEKGGTGGWLIDHDALTTLSWLSAFGAKAVPEAEGGSYTFESPEGEKAISFMRGMFDQGCAWLGRNPMPFDYFARRMALFYSGSLSNVFTQASYQTQVQSKDQWTVLPFPGQDGQPVLYASGYSYGILKSKTPEDQLAAWLFLRWMEQPKIAVKLAQALPSLPVSSAVAAQAGGSDAAGSNAAGSNAAAFPWPLVRGLGDQARPAPTLASWRDARRLLEDASWQVFNLPAEGLSQVLPQTLPQLDSAIQEMLKKSP